MSPEHEVAAEFVMDEPYYRENHDEWVAALGPGFRASRVMIEVFAALGLCLGLAGWWTSRVTLGGLGAGMLVIAALEHRRLLRRTRLWLEHCRTLPWYGQTMRIVLVAGDLVQVKDFPGDPRYVRTGEVVATPNGWLVRYSMEGTMDAANVAVSAERAMIYIPHRTIHPPMDRETFAGLVRAPTV